MKIKVKKEGRDNIFIPEKKSLKEFIINKGFKQIHNYIPSGNLVFDDDCDVESVLKHIDKAKEVRIFIKDAMKQNLNHALSLIIDNNFCLFDIGKITKNNLEIIE